MITYSIVLFTCAWEIYFSKNKAKTSLWSLLAGAVGILVAIRMGWMSP